MQSYVSRLFLLVAKESSELVFIVDNGPWTSPEYRFRPAELWQLMVTQVYLLPCSSPAACNFSLNLTNSKL